MSRPQNKHLRPNPASLGVTPLERGQQSKPIRVRGSDLLFAWLAGHSPAQIGQMLEAHREQALLTVDAATEPSMQQPNRQH